MGINVSMGHHGPIRTFIIAHILTMDYGEKQQLPLQWQPYPLFVVK